MRWQSASRLGLAGWSMAPWVCRSWPGRPWSELLFWPAVKGLRRSARQLLGLGWAVWLGLAGLEVLSAAEPRVHGSNRNSSPILVTPVAGGVAISSDDVEALDQFVELFAALAATRSSNNEEMVVFYLKHARAAAVAEIVEAVFSGGSLADEPQPAGAFFGSFGLPGMSTGGFSRGVPFGAPGGFRPRFGRERDGTAFDSRGSQPGAEGASASASGRNAPLDAGRNPGRSRPGTLRQAGSAVRVTADPRLNALVVQAKPGDMDIVEQLLKILDQPGTPEVVPAEPRPRLIPVRHVPVQSVLAVLRQVYQDRLTNAGSTPGSGRPGGTDQGVVGQGPNGPGPPGFPQGPGGLGAGPAQFFQQLALASGSAGRHGRSILDTEERPKMALSADTRSNSLVVVAPDPMYEEVRELVRQLDRPATDKAEAVQVLALRGSNAELVRRALPAFMGDRVRVSQAAASPTSIGRPTRGPAAGGWQGSPAAGDGWPAGWQGPPTNDTGAPTASPLPAPPAAASAAAGPNRPAAQAGQGPVGAGNGASTSGVMGRPVPGAPLPPARPGSRPVPGEPLPPQPPGDFPLQGPPTFGPDEFGEPAQPLPEPPPLPPQPLP